MRNSNWACIISIFTVTFSVGTQPGCNDPRWSMNKPRHAGSAGPARPDASGADQRRFDPNPLDSESAGSVQAGSAGTGAATGTNAPTSNGPDVVVMRLHFNVRRVDLPIDNIRHSLKIWNHVDETLGDPSQNALLARNGIRMGVADRDAWSTMQVLFEANNARSNERRHTAMDGTALLVPLARMNDGDTYFLHERDTSFRGGAFEQGQLLWRIEYALNEDDPSRVILRVTPEFRSSATTPRLVESAGEIVEIRDHEGMTFHELTTSVNLKPSQFLVIGPSEQANQPYLLGSWLSTSELDRQRLETVLCISPEPVRIQ